MTTNEERAMPRDSESSDERRSDDGSSDGEIVVAVRGGDVAAFESLVQRYWSKLLRTAYARLGDSAAAEDAVQNTFLAAFRSLETYDPRFRFRSWLWTILTNQCRSDYRKTKREETVTESLANSLSAQEKIANATTSGAPDRRLIQSEQLQSIHQHLKKLPSEQSEAIQLRFFGEMKYDEIAKAMQCGLTTAKNRVRVGLERLSRTMQSEQSEHADEQHDE